MDNSESSDLLRQFEFAHEFLITRMETLGQNDLAASLRD